MIDPNNSTATPILATETWTGTWFDVQGFNSISILADTDVAGTLYADFSTNGTDVDRHIQLSSSSTVVSGIHNLIPVAKYFRVLVVNGTSNQTTMVVQTMYSTSPRIALPTSRNGQAVSNYTDALSVKSISDYKAQVALGQNGDVGLWNKFGFNTDVDIGTEVVASWGGMFVPPTTASTISIVSTSASDTAAGVGAQSVLIYGVNASRQTVIEVVPLDGITPVVTTSTWLGINRLAIYVSGTSQVNIGEITATFVTGSTIQGQIPAGDGSSQQLIYFTPVDSTSLITYILIKGNKLSGGTSPIIIFKLWVYSAVSNSKYLVLQYEMDSAIENHVDFNFAEPLVIGQKSVTWLEVTTDQNNTVVSGRFSLTEYASFS